MFLTGNIFLLEIASQIRGTLCAFPLHAVCRLLCAERTQSNRTKAQVDEALVNYCVAFLLRLRFSRIRNAFACVRCSARLGEDFVCCPTTDHRPPTCPRGSTTFAMNLTSHSCTFRSLYLVARELARPHCSLTGCTPASTY